MSSWQEYADEDARKLVQMFREHLAPLLLRVCPQWIFHHIRIVRHSHWEDEENCVEIRLILRPFGSVREGEDKVIGGKLHKRIK